MSAFAARSLMRSAARSATILSSGVSPFRISSQKPLSARIFRSPVERISVGGGPFAAANQGKVACFSSSSSSSSSKRFQRVQRKKVDLKRNTSSIGIVEGIEYDANRTSRIALVRWEGSGLQRKSNTIGELSTPEISLESTTTVRGSFAFSSLPGLGEQNIKNSVSNVFSSAFSSPKAKAEPAFPSSFGFPRITVAGARPAFFVLGKEVEGKTTFSTGEIRRWRPDSIFWTHRNKPKAAVSWHSFAKQEGSGTAQASFKKNKSKAKIDQGFDTKGDRAPLSYILACHKLEKGMMVINWSKPPTSNLSRRTQNASAY